MNDYINNNQDEENDVGQELDNINEREIEEGIKKTQSAIKDSASLAKNVATGNILGTAKDAIKVTKNKKLRNKMIKGAIMKILVPILIVVLLASAVFVIMDIVASTVQEIIDGIDGFFDIDPTDGSINISNDEIDAIIEAIENLGISVEDLGLLGDFEESATEEQKKEQMRIYIRKFYEAQVVTETLNYYHKKSTPTKTYGTVYVYRANGANTDDTSNRIALTFKEYEEMKKMQEKNDVKALEHFSVDESGNLVVAGTTRTIVEKGSDTSKLSKANDSTTVTLRTINYKSAISKYTTKMNFLVYLTLISHNPEFVSALVDLIKDSRIEITIMDNVTTNIENNTYKYLKHTRSKHSHTDSEGNKHYSYSNSSELKTEITKTTVINTNPTAKITYVKTWFCEQKITYRKTEKAPTNSDYTLTGEDTDYLEDEEPITGNNTGSWKTDQSEKHENSYTESLYEEAVRGDVKFILGQRGDSERYKNGEIDEPTFIGLMETKFRIPYTTREEEAGSNLVSGAEMLFGLLQKDPNLEHMEQIMRYALYLYTGNDYGVTSLDGSIFEIGDFTSVSGVYGNTAQEKVWFTLREAGYSEYAVAGVMGNIEAESGFRPSAIEGGNGIGAGLCQWSFGRRTQLEMYIQSKGTTLADIDSQVEFLLTEITPGGVGPAQGYATYQLVTYKGYSPEMWENAQSPTEAAIAFCWTFERPGIPRMNVRTSAAEKYYNEFHGRERPNGGTTQPCNGDGYTQIYTASNGNSYKEYKQYMGSYKNILYQPYGKPIRSDGCSITAIAVILTGYGIDVNPGDLASHNRLAQHIRKYGIQCTDYETADRNKMMSGKPALVSISGNLKIEGSTKYYGGHYVAILDARGNDEVYISDVGSAMSGWAKVDDIINIVNRGIIYIK